MINCGSMGWFFFFRGGECERFVGGGFFMCDC